jgi:D-alanyl-D-alanine carboxypeptidase/D-alanyl-D-alanine-endopeptidase (penicillin-binding protein 4)
VSRFAHVERRGTLRSGARGHADAGGARLKVLCAVVVVAVVFGLGIAALLRSRPDHQGTTGPLLTPGQVQPLPSEPGLSFAQPSAPPPVLAGVDTSKAVSVHRLKRLLGHKLQSRRLGGHVGFAVAALGSHRLLWSSGGSAPVTPASTMKLLTTTTALVAMGPGHRFTTSVVQGRDRRQIVLVGGGDPLLTDKPPTPAERPGQYPRRATFQQLAARTAARLGREHVSSVRLGYDDSLFSGPAVNPHWEPTYIPESVVSPISALWVDEGRVAPGGLTRVADPARVAAQRFAALLHKQGIDVAATVAHVHARRHAVSLASVQSAPLSEIIQSILEHSDNEGAEVLLRQLAIASGRAGTSAAGVRVVEKTMARLGVSLRGASLYDGSGLSRDDRVPVPALVSVLQVDASTTHPQLRTVVSSLPVAGFSGSLAYRFLNDAPEGLGLVRAKTGTLTGVHALAGIVSTRSGKALVFAAVADRVPVSKTFVARVQLDKVSGTLATCGC